MSESSNNLGRLTAVSRVEAAAGTTPCAVVQQDGGSALGVIVANDRDRRTFAWLRSQVGDEAISGAVGRLVGGRKPYPSNVAKVLGVVLPECLERPNPETVRASLQAFRSRLGI